MAKAAVKWTVQERFPASWSLWRGQSKHGALDFLWGRYVLSSGTKKREKSEVKLVVIGREITNAAGGESKSNFYLLLFLSLAQDVKRSTTACVAEKLTRGIQMSVAEAL